MGFLTCIIGQKFSLIGYASNKIIFLKRLFHEFKMTAITA